MDNFFEMSDYLEPRCPNCSTKIEYDVTTRYDELREGHICIKCGTLLK
jgi:hypothetical protein